MDRRHFLLAIAATGLAAAAPRPAPARFTVEVRGAGRDVVLIPGLTAGREVWAATVAAVPGYRYHLIQVAGFAGAPAAGNSTGPVIAPLAEAIARYIAAQRLDRPAIVGHSMGGTLALMIAARHPELAGRIMVVDMLPQPAGLLGGSAADWGPVADRLGAWFETPGGRQVFASFMTAFSPPGSANGRSDPDVVSRTAHELAATDLTRALPNIRAPLTVVYAAPDRVTQGAIDRTFAAAYAGARNPRLIRIDNSGHMVMHDQPARFQAALRRFLTAA